MATANDNTKQQILELFFCSDDNRIKTISETLNVSKHQIRIVIEDYFTGHFVFLRGNYTILHSEINNNK
jgi:predicted ArsR family transcriptional regulator